MEVGAGLADAREAEGDKFATFRRTRQARNAYPRANPEQKNDAETEAETIERVPEEVGLVSRVSSVSTS